MKSHRHLQQEIKNELDRAASDVRRAESMVMEMEFEYNERIDNVADGLDRSAKISKLMEQKELRQENIGLEDAYSVQIQVARRFAVISNIYKIACSATSGSVITSYIRDAIYKHSSTLATMPEADKIIEDLAVALEDYLNGSMDDKNDRKVRRSWQKIEHLIDT